MNKFNIDKIKNMKIPLFPSSVQTTIINYYNYSNNVYQSNLKEIEEYKLLITNMFNIINTNEYEDLGNIVNIYNNDDTR
jgi:hypothetical protein